MRRRAFITLLGGATAWPVVARAQQPMLVIGFLSAVSAGSVPTLVGAFRQGLAGEGYAEGRNVAIEYRWAEGSYDRLPTLAADLIRRRVAAIVAAGVDAAHAAKEATSTIPIVFLMSGDPVTERLVPRLNQPGGNLTGVTSFSGLLSAKRLEILRELVPAARIFVLMNPINSNAPFRLKEIEEASRTLSLQTQILNIGTGDDIDTEFASLAARGAGGLLVVDDPLFDGLRTKLVIQAARHRIPTIYFQSDFVREGELISYAANYADQYRQIGIYTGQILKGAKPGDLPVMQPTKFELVINLTTAKALGIDVPPQLLARADEVIE